MSTELDNIFKEYYKVEYIPISDKWAVKCINSVYFPMRVIGLSGFIPGIHNESEEIVKVYKTKAAATKYANKLNKDEATNK